MLVWAFCFVFLLLNEASAVLNNKCKLRINREINKWISEADDFCTVTTCKTHNNITAQVVKGRRVTLEGSIKINQVFINMDHPTQIVQLSGARDQPVYLARKGFVNVATIAYNQHHDLVWRPDDVWQAILIQFSLYVTQNSERLRDKFVDFKGERKLKVKAFGTLFTVDFGNITRRMVDEQIVKNIKDPSIADWLIPKFSTTTENDRIVASVSMMATLQSYFEYEIVLLCGLPSITLLGTINDWKLLRDKVDRLLEFDTKDGLMKKWLELLTVVLDEFVETKSGVDNMEFWDRICHFEEGGSGPTYLSGWITTFAVFNKDGEWQGDKKEINNFGTIIKTDWPLIETDGVPSGAIAVPIVIVESGIAEYKGHMIAGHFAYDGINTTVQPRADWCITVGHKKSLLDVKNNEL